MADRPLRRRRRAARTCVECRRRKIKCDRQEPCNHCIATRATCSYRPFARTDEIHETPVAATNTCPLDNEHSFHGHEQAGSDDGTTRAIPEIVLRSRSNPTTSPDRQSSEAHGASPLWEHLLEKGIEAEKQQSNPNNHPSRQQLLQSKEAEGPRSQILLNKTRMLQVGHVLGSAPQFKTILSCFLAATGERPDPAFQNDRDGTAGMVGEMGKLLRECKDMARRLKESRPSRTLSSVRFDLSLPSREVSDTMAKLYFSHFESTHRILHEPSFWREYNEFWDRKNSIRQTLGDPLNYRSPTHTRLKMLLVLAIGSALHRDATTDFPFRARAQQWIHASQVWLSGPLEKDRLDISGIQIYCLTIIARQVFAIGGDLAWMSCGTLVHMAMQTGLHRDPEHFMKGSISVLDAEIRRRLWATILELVVGVSLDVALPTRVRWDEFDTEPPANVNDEDLTGEAVKLLEMAGPTKPRGKERGIYTSASMQLMMYESLELRLGVLNKLHGLKSELSYVEILSLSSAVTKAYNEALTLLNKFFVSQKPRSPTSTPPMLTEASHEPKLFHKNFVDLLLRRLLLHMHFSFAARAHAEPLFHFSLKTCLDGAIDMLHAVDSQPHKDIQQPQYHTAHNSAAQQQPDLAFSRLIIIGGGMFRELLRSSLSIICLELLAIIQESYGMSHAAPPNSAAAAGVNPFFSPSNIVPGAAISNSASVPPIWQQSASTNFHIATLKQAAAQVISLSLERIENGGETNIKGYLFARLFMAEVESIEAGLKHYNPHQTESVAGGGATTIENAMARAGRDSMLLCRDAVREWESRAKEQGHQTLEQSRSASVVGVDALRDGSDTSLLVPGPGRFGMPAGAGFNRSGVGYSGSGSGGMVDVFAEQGNGMGMPPLADVPYGVALGDGIGDYVGFSFDGFESFGFEMGSGLHAFLR